MSLLPFLAIAFGAGTAALLTRHRADLSGALGIGGLALAAIAAVGAPVLERLGVASAPPDVAGFLTLGALTALLVLLAGAGVGTVARSLPGAVLLTLGASGMALLAPTPAAAILFATAAAVVALIPLLDPGAVGERGAVAAAIAIRVAVLAGLAGLAALALVTVVPADGAARGLALLAVVAAAGVRLGVIPLHRPAARLAGLAPLAVLPLVAVWAPAAFAWVAALAAGALPGELPPIERTVVVVLALGGIALAALAALIHDDLPHIAGYGIALDGAVALLAFTASPSPAGDSLRSWLLILAVTRTAFVGWAIAVGGPVGVRRIAELRGWVRRSPLLALALFAIAVALVGWPGSAVWQARAGLFEGALGGPFGALGVVVAAASAATVVRLLIGGVGRPEPGAPREPREPEGWRLRLRLATASALLLAGLGVVVAAGWVS